MGYGPTGSARGDANYGDRPVTFKYSDAERIASAVHQYETGRRPPKGSKLPRATGPGPVRYATFTGGWFKGEYKVVTVVATTATSSIYNALFDVISYSNTTSRSCFVSGGFLLNADCVRP